MTETTRYVKTLSYGDRQLLRKREFQIRGDAYKYRKLSQDESRSFGDRYKACVTAEHLFQIAQVYTDVLSGKVSLQDSVMQMTRLRLEFDGKKP